MLETSLVQILTLGGDVQDVARNVRGGVAEDLVLCVGCDNESGVIDAIIANPSGGSPAQIWHVGCTRDSGVNLANSSLIRKFKWPYDDKECAKVGK